MASRVAELDAAGFLPSPGETEEDFVRRAESILERHREFDRLLEEEGRVAVFGIEASREEKIDPGIIASAGEVTWELYRFRTLHVPGFFLSRSVGLLWGGVLIGDPDERFSLFLVRDSFRTRERWLFYRRTELFAHELCHSMRMELKETTLEEYFAYQTSPSALRRYLGNCFIRDIDAILFVVPAVLLLAATVVRDFFLPGLPVWLFWILALVYPAFLLIRNASSRRVVRRAAKKLAAFGVREISPVLFRCTREELICLGGLAGASLFDRFRTEKAREELRWKIINERFINDGKTVEQEEPPNGVL